jgi:gas vesicle protein
MSAGKVFLGLMAGLTAGAILGVLYAPEKGSVTRENIARKTEDYAEAVKEKFNEFIDSVNDKLDMAKEELGKGRQKVEEVKRDVKTATS